MQAGARWHQKLGALKQRLRDATDLSDPWDYFHDELALNREFIAAGRPNKNAQLTSVIERIAERLLGRPIAATQKLFIHLRAERFWHGTCRLEHRPLVFFYFEDIDVGFAGFMDAATELVRFTVVELPANVFPARDRGQA